VSSVPILVMVESSMMLVLPIILMMLSVTCAIQERFGMGAAENRNKAQKLAAHLAVRSPIRTQSACPWHCGAMIKTGGPALMSHLTVCRGNPRKNGRSRDGRSMV
jgi:hypothetical protein